MLEPAETQVMLDSLQRPPTDEQLPEPTHALMEIIDHNGVPLVADPFRFMGEAATS